MKIPGLSFSWKRALGITQVKQKIALQQAYLTQQIASIKQQLIHFVRSTIKCKRNMKRYHWLLLLNVTIITLLLTGCSNHKMKINGVDIRNGYETVKQELMKQPGVKLHDEDTPIVPIGSYDFALLPSYGDNILMRSTDSLSYEGFKSIVNHYSEEYGIEPIIEGRDKFMQLESKGSDQLFDYNSNTHAFYKIIAQATDYGDGALFEIDKYNYIFVVYTSNWRSYHVNILFFVL